MPSKKYLSILKTFVNGRKIPTIPVFLVKENEKFITNSFEKANLFNKLSANQSTLPKFNIYHIESRLSDTNLTTRK